MAKIIYGVSGQGFGHATRSREILKYLISAGHEVLVFTYGQALFFLDKDFEVFEVPGLGLDYKDNKLVYWQTIYKNIKQLAKQSKHWKKILAKCREFNPDIIITDFEPLTALLAKIQRLPLISLDNQHQMTNTKIAVPAKYRKDLLADKLIVKSLVWGADYYFITSFFETPIIKKNTLLFPPVLRREILDSKKEKQDFILVYYNSGLGEIENILKEVNFKFVTFGTNKTGIEKNLEYKNYSSDEWLEDLSHCRAIIGTAGSSLISEAIYLEKPYLASPIKRQVEQIINAEYLDQMGLGQYCHAINKEEIKKFIQNLPQYDQALRAYTRDNDNRIFQKLDEVIKKIS